VIGGQKTPPFCPIRIEVILKHTYQSHTYIDSLCGLAIYLHPRSVIRSSLLFEFSDYLNQRLHVAACSSIELNQENNLNLIIAEKQNRHEFKLLSVSLSL
jgi:hypothetical protein